MTTAEVHQRAVAESSSLRHSVHAISVLWLAAASSAGFGFVTQTLLARALGPAQFGVFASSLATVTMAAPLAGFGLSQFWLKAYGVEGSQAIRWMAPSRTYVWVSTVGAIGGLVSWAFATDSSGSARTTMLAFVPIIPGALAVDLLGGKFRLEERYATLARWQLALPILRLLVAALAVVMWHAAWPVAVGGYAASSLLVTACAAAPLRELFRGNIHLPGRHTEAHVRVTTTPSAQSLWAETWAYGLGVVLYPVFFQVGTVLLKRLSSDEQAGIFGVALAVMTAVYLLPTTVYQMFLNAKLHRWAAHDRPQFWRVYSRGNVAMLALGVLAGVLIATLAPWVVPILFGTRYAAVVDVLIVLSVCAPLRYLSSAVGSVLLTGTYIRFRVFAMAVAAFVAVSLNLLLVPRLGARGAAWATVVSETVLLATMLLGARRLRRDDLQGVPRGGASS